MSALPRTTPADRHVAVPVTNRTGRLREWLEQRIAPRTLTIAALATWLALGVALVLEHVAGADRALVTAIFVLAYLAGGTIATRAALADLRERTVNVDLLMVLAALGAVTLGAWMEGAILLALFATSNALEHHALARTHSAVRSLMQLAPDEASRMTGDGAVQTVPVATLAIGDRLLIRPGERIPADAEVVSGSTTVDQSAITGESIPVARSAGHRLFAGSVNGSGAIEARVTQLASESTVAKIVRMVEAAQAQKSRAERFTDAFEGPYAVGVIVASVLVAIVPLLWGADAGMSFYRAMTLLVVASPCALVISTPAATLSAIASAARNGILVKGGHFLDRIGVVDTVAFDKTGTLTHGTPRVTDIVPLAHADEREVLAIAAAAEHASEHPLARAIVDEAACRRIPLARASSLAANPGRGISAMVGDARVLVGNAALLGDAGVELDDAIRASVERVQADGRTVMLVARDGDVIGLIGVADTVRPEAIAAVRALRDLGLRRIVMLTGDNATVAGAIGRAVGVDEVHADLLPADKLALIEQLQRGGSVAMIGDGINDAPALARADIGVAMGAAGTDVALESANLVLMADDLGKLAEAIALSRRMRRVIRANMAFSLGVIAVLVLSTLSVGIPLPLGVVGHEGSTVIVILSGLRLLVPPRRDRPLAKPVRPAAERPLPA